VAGAQPAKDPTGLSILTGRSNLALRVISSLVLAPAALAAAWVGGIPFALFWSAAALIVLWEWQSLVTTRDRNAVLAIGAAALLGAAVLLTIGWPGTATAFFVLGLLGMAAIASRARRRWCVTGLAYATVAVAAPILLRKDVEFGFAAIIFLFVVVWLTDIAAYFAGRAIGGPKLMPEVSPKKTWAGAVGGTLAGVVGGVLAARQLGVGVSLATALIALGLSIVSQAGDLFESWVKRCFHTKDASTLIPGHGGAMDRLDGFVAAAFAAAVVGLAHGGLSHPARGLLVW